MKMSKLGTKTLKSSKEYDSKNATYLIKGGFIDMTMAGAYTFLPLGLRVLTKIENIIRKEMDKLAAEVLMTALSPKQVWEQTNRINTVDVLMQTVGANEHSRNKSTNEYILNSTHEEVITPIAYKFNRSYKDFPFAFYQIQTKFRNEARAKSGILRGREFRMKDLYSFHTSEEDLKKYYEEVKKAYVTVFEKLGLGNDTVIALASGGDFTKDYSHEFQTRCDAGEDMIYLNKKTGIAYNQEVAPQDAIENKSEDEYEVFPACEVGNIFPLNTKFSKAFDYTYIDATGKENSVYMGCYGIGSSRVMGVLVEKFHDEAGIIWPIQVAPYAVQLIGMNGSEQETEDLYNTLTAMNIEVLWDDRDVSAGQKFSDADLIGNPIRLVVSKRNSGKIELKLREQTEPELLDSAETIAKVSDYVTNI